MGFKLAITMLVMLMLVGGEHGSAMPVVRGLNLGWMNGIEGGSPGGTNPSDTAFHAKVGKNRLLLVPIDYL